MYEETVKLLLGRWQRAREVCRPDGELEIEPGVAQALGVGEERIRATLESLAFTIHQRQRRSPERDDGPADIGEGDLLVAFKPLLGDLPPDTLLAYFRDRAGLIVARDEGVYAFPHRSFQEYLAACYLANGPEFAERLVRLAWEDPAWWREVCLLGVGKARLGGLGNAVAVVNVMLPEGPEDAAEKTDAHWRIAALAGQALIELRLVEKAAGQPHYMALLKRGAALADAVGRGRFPGAARTRRGRRRAGPVGRSPLRSGRLLSAVSLPRPTRSRRTASWRSRRDRSSWAVSRARKMPTMTNTATRRA